MADAAGQTIDTQAVPGLTITGVGPDMIALEAVATTGLAVRTAADTWTTRQIVAPAAGITVTPPAGAAGDPTIALANDLAGIEALAATGLVARTADGAFAARTMTAPAAGIAIANADGVAGAPGFTLANDLAAYEGLAATGLVARTADGAAAARTLAMTGDGITVTDGDGVAANPTLTLNHDLAALEALDATAGLVVKTAADTYARRTLTGTAGQVAIADGAGTAANPTVSLPAVANSAAAGEISIAPQFVINLVLGDVATGDYDYTMPVGFGAFKIVDVMAVKVAAAGGANDTIIVENGAGGGAVTNTLDMNVADEAVVRATTFDDAECEFGAGGIVRLAVVDGGAANTAAHVQITVAKR